MEIISTLFMGLVVGILAKFIMPGKDPGGIIVTILIGIAGSYVGSLLLGSIVTSLLGIGIFSNIVVGTIGGLILLAIWRYVIAPMISK